MASPKVTGRSPEHRASIYLPAPVTFTVYPRRGSPRSLWDSGSRTTTRKRAEAPRHRTTRSSPTTVPSAKPTSGRCSHRSGLPTVTAPAPNYSSSRFLPRQQGFVVQWLQGLPDLRQQGHPAPQHPTEGTLREHYRARHAVPLQRQRASGGASRALAYTHLY